jgi:UDP-glucose-4-epimerase GalE
MKVLVTGGAGYVGSHTVRTLKARGHDPLVFDNLSRGHREAVLEADLVEGDLLNPQDLEDAFAGRGIEAVLHFAALAYVGESVEKPDLYYRNNIGGTLNLLEAMRRHGVEKLIFSSTCATYGDSSTPCLSEDHPQRPVNPYGRSKLLIEWVLRDYDAAFGMRSVALRYFNASGCSLDGRIGEDHDPETHLIPRVLLAARGKIPHVTILGTDWNTPDGTCIRDYVHVEDLAEAHVLALEYLAGGGPSTNWNLGTGKGYSVRDIVTGAERITGRRVPVLEGPRRPGDPAVLKSGIEKVSRELGWRPRRSDLDTIIGSAWRWIERGGRYSRETGN